MLKTIVFVSAELLAVLNALAKKFALSRSEVIRRCLQHGVDPLRKDLESGAPARVETTSRSKSNRPRASAQSQSRLWRLPGDLEIHDALCDLCDEVLEKDPCQDRAAIRQQLEASGIAAEADDSAAVIERALRTVLGVPGHEHRPLPGHEPPE